MATGNVQGPGKTRPAVRKGREVRYQDFVAKPRRRWPMVALLALALAGAAAATAYFAFPQWFSRTQVGAPPPALSDAGGPVPGETYHWQNVAIGGGGFITGLSLDNSGKTFVVRTDVYGAYLWSNAQNRWFQLITAQSLPAEFRDQAGLAQGAFEVAVAPSLPSRIFIAIGGTVLRSNDGGLSFLASTPGGAKLDWDANGSFRLHGPGLAVDPRNADLVLLGTPRQGLWRSVDGGVQWSRVASIPAALAGKDLPAATKIWFKPQSAAASASEIWVQVPGRGFFSSRDGGASFAPLPAAGDQPRDVRRAVFDRNGIFYAADDAARTVWIHRDGRWHNMVDEAGLRARDFAAIAANPHADQVVVFDQGGAGYQTVDNGRSWTSVSHAVSVGEGDPPWLKVSDAAYFATADVRFDPVVRNRLWVAAGTGVFRADFPPGTSVAAWTSQTRGIEELVANDVVQAPGQSPVLGGWDFGLHVKEDLTRYSTTFGPGPRALISVQQMDWTPADPKFLVTNASDMRMNCCSEDGNAVMAGTSRDGGRSWSKFRMLPTPPGTSENDPWRMAFGTIAVSASDPDNIVWAPAFNRQPFYTSDGGWSWKPVALAGASGDAPGSFSRNFFQRKTLASDKVKPGTFYLYHSGEPPNEGLQGLWRSEDAGANWVQIHAGEIAPGSAFAAKLRAVPGKAGHLFFTSGSRSPADRGMRRSRDGGSKWEIVPRVSDVDDVAFGKAARGASYPTIFLSGRLDGKYGIWRSIDDAGTWQRLADFPVGTLDQVTAIGADPDVFGRVYLGYKGSGWVWGEPATCTSATLKPLSGAQCRAVD